MPAGGPPTVRVRAAAAECPAISIALQAAGLKAEMERLKAEEAEAAARVQAAQTRGARAASMLEAARGPLGSASPTGIAAFGAQDDEDV